MVLPSGLPAHGKVAGPGREGYTPYLPQGRGERLSSISLLVHVSHLILAHQSASLQSHADGGRDVALKTTTDGGSIPLQETPTCQGGAQAPQGEVLPGFAGTA